jgi:hypothetical protein
MIRFTTVVRLAKATAGVVAIAIGLIALGLAGPGSRAKADWYSFSYNNGLVGTGTNIIFTGQLSGTMTSGTLAVTGFRDLVYNGIALSGTANPFDDGSVGGFFDVSGEPTGSPFVTISGSAMNLAILGSGQNDYLGFGVSTFDSESPLFGSTVFVNSFTTVTPTPSPDLAGNEQAFNVGGWTLAAVPEPSQVVLLASAGVVFGGWRLRRLRRGRPVGDDALADG